MKKISIVLVLFFFIMTLTSCNNEDLENDFFENEERQSFSDMDTLLTQRISDIKHTLDLVYPRQLQEASLSHDSQYVRSNIHQRDQIYRHEFFNYLIGDDRDYMTTELYFLESRWWFYIEQECGETKEGEVCTNIETTSDGSVTRTELVYYMEDTNLLVDLIYTMNQNILVHMSFYIYETETYKDVVEVTIRFSNIEQTDYEFISHTIWISGESEESFVCVACDLDDPSTGHLHYIYREYKSTPISSYNDSTIAEYVFLNLYSDETIQGDVFNGETNEKFHIIKSSENIESTSYTKYTSNIEEVTYSNYHYKVNLNEILGWDKVVKISGRHNQYQLFYGDDLLSGEEHVSLSSSTSEYMFYMFDVEGYDPSVIPDQVIDLSIVGLETDYSHTYFEDKLEEGVTYFETLVEKHDLNQSYEDNYSTFIEIIQRLDSINPN